MARAPRMDPYLRLLARFYEALVLLRILRPVVGPHIVSHLDKYSLRDAQRRLLSNLAFLCDDKKGGESTTAIATEERPDCYVFWVASNEGCKERVTDFLSDILECLRRITNRIDDGTTAEKDLIAKSTLFALPRLKKEVNILRNAAKKCRIHLETSQIEDNDLSLWLRRLEDLPHDDPATCETAYAVRRDEHLRRIERLGQESDSAAISNETASAFRTVKHMIGRLAARVRAVKEIVYDGSRLPILRQSCCVESVQKPLCATVPRADGHTTLDSILRRLLQAGDSRYEAFLVYLTTMYEQAHIESIMHEKFEPGALKSCVHAEMQMLHHFHDKGLRFAGDDRFIGCSKFACICCELYFRHHPSRITLLDSHQKVYPNWGIMSLPSGARDPDWLGWRKVMSDVLLDLKAMVIEQIEQRQLSSLNHADSLSQITPSLADGEDYSNSGTDHFDDFDERTVSDDGLGPDSGIGLEHLSLEIHDYFGEDSSDSGSGVKL